MLNYIYSMSANLGWYLAPRNTIKVPVEVGLCKQFKPNDLLIFIV